MTWHGLTDDEVIAACEPFSWQTRVTNVLQEVAECDDATAEDRLAALQMLNVYTLSKVLPDNPAIPEYMMWAMLEIAECKKLRRKESVQKMMSERLFACSALLQTMSQFIVAPDTKAEAEAVN